MKLLVVLLLAAVAYGARYEKATTKIPGSFLIKVKDRVSLSGFVNQFESQFVKGKVNFKWDNLNTISVNLPEVFVQRLLTLDAIEYVEEDGVFYTQAVGSWGIDRIDQRDLPLDLSYTAPRTGSGQTVYVIDTGIRYTHNDYGGRASFHHDYEQEGTGEDCNGHGTHCAGIAGSATYGVAPGVSLKSVRVLSCFGSGSTTNVVNGVNSIMGLSVGSMAIGGGASSTMDNAVASAVNRGVVMSVAAGNNNANACNYSPAREPSAITVGSTDNRDYRSQASNYGMCLDLFAPGVSITSTWHTSDTATNTLSGSSMACAHVSGAAALLLARGVPAGSVPSTMVSEATPNKISDPSGSNNKLLYVQ
ncbi:aqualysin-1-like [Amphiura filiformis]|uniref:aqualysin-1-like n=1 Tax=Amphiura filiformis TaxID=82378 RepID=UPI003B222854